MVAVNMANHEQVHRERLLFWESSILSDLQKALFEVWLVNLFGTAIDNHQSRLVFGPEVEEKAISMVRLVNISFMVPGIPRRPFMTAS